MTTRRTLPVLAAALLLSGCASGDDPVPSLPPAAVPTTASATPSPTPASDEPVVVDPSAYAMRLDPGTAGGGNGVEFITQDDVIHCGIYTAYRFGAFVEDGFTVIAGCRATPTPTIERPADAPDIPCTGLFVSDHQPGSVFCNSGAVFAGDDPYTYPGVPILEPGTALEFDGARCEALDDGSVRCTVGEHGFELSALAYSLF